jgi:MFS family permease
MGLRRLLGVLTEREFRRLYLARAFSLFGDGLVPVALAFAVLNLDRSASALGFVLAARSVSLVLFLLVGGVVADRLPRQQVMIAADLLRLLTQGTTAALLISGHAAVWHLIVLAFFYGGGAAFFLPASTGLIPETVRAEHLQQANALLSLTNSSFFIAGPVVAGGLVATVGPGWALAADAATFLVSAAFLARLRLPERSGRLRSPFLGELRTGWQEFRSRTWLWVDGVYSALGNFAILSPLWALGPLVATRSLGGATAWATIVTAFGIGAVFGGLLLLRIRPTRPLLTGIPALALLGLPPALLAIPAPTLVIAAGALTAGLGLSIFNTLFETTVQEYVPPESLSRVASIDWVLSVGLQPIGFALVGPLAILVGIRATLSAAAVWALVSTAVVLTIPSVRNLRRRDLDGHGRVV